MRPVALSAFSLVLFALSTPADEPKKEEAIPCNLDKLEKEWNLKLKSMTVMDGADRLKNQVKQLRITIEFTKDVSDVKAIRKAFESSFTLEKVPAKERPPHVLVYFFDEDNVVQFKTMISHPEGELTGKAGDAFRVVVNCPPAAFAKVKKVEMRMSEKE